MQVFKNQQTIYLTVTAYFGTFYVLWPKITLTIVLVGGGLLANS